MKNDLFPTPWKIEGGTIVDAKGQPLLYAAGGVYDHPEVLETIVRSREMHAALQEARIGLLSSMRTLRNALRLLVELSAETRSPELARAIEEMYVRGGVITSPADGSATGTGAASGSIRSA